MNVVINLISHASKCGETFFRGALSRPRVFQAPTKEPKSKRKNRAALFRLVAKTDGVSEAFVENRWDVLDLLTGDVDSDFFHCVYCQWTDGRWLDCSAYRGQGIAGDTAHETFGHLTSFRMTCT